MAEEPNDVKMDMEKSRALVFHYAGEGLYQHVRDVCTKILRASRGGGNEVELRFWLVFASLSEGASQECVRTLETLQQKSKGKCELPILVALMHAHSNCDLVDDEAVTSLKSAIKKAESRAGTRDFLMVANFFRLLKPQRLKDARKATKKALKLDPKSIKAQTLQGWLELIRAEKRPELLQTAARCFQPALREKTLDSLLGLARYFVLKRQFEKALEAINQAIVRHSWYVPALLDKAQILVMMGDWDQAQATAKRILEKDPMDVEALRVLTLHYLVRDGNMEQIEANFSLLNKSLAKREKRNAALHYAMSCPLARLLGRNKRLLRLSLAMVERAADMQQTTSSYFSECAFQHVLAGDLAAGLRMYRQSAKLDESNVQALQGMIQCQLLQGQLKDAEEQLEFFSVIVDSIGQSPGVVFLNAELAWYKQGDEDKHIELLGKVLDLHWRQLDTSEVMRNTLPWYKQYNADFLLQIAQQYLLHCSDEPLLTSDSPSEALREATSLLVRISRQIPGSVATKLLLAKCHFIMGTEDSLRRAEALLSKCLALDPSSAAAYLLVARIALQRDQFERAAKALEEALSKDFNVRKDPMFHLIKAKVWESKGKLKEAKEILVKALELPVFDTCRQAAAAEAKQAKGKGGRSGATKQQQQRGGQQGKDGGGGADAMVASNGSALALVYERLAALCYSMKQPSKAEQFVATALQLFAGTSLEVRLRIVESRQAVRRGDVQAALKMLSVLTKAGAREEAWLQATQVKATIYLEHRRSKERYSRCYAMIASRLRNKRGYVLLGDSFMRIQEPAEAIAAYERALELEPEDITLTVMIGKALMTTHNYQGAIDYFTSALSSRNITGSRKMTLRLALAELFTKLHKWNGAKKVLNQALTEKRNAAGASNAEGSGDVAVTSLIEDVRLLLLLADVCFGSNDEGQAVEVLQRARLLQNKVLAKVGPNSNDTPAQRRIAAEIRCKIGTHYASFDGASARKENNATARDYFVEALKHDDTHEPSLMSLARLQMLHNDADECQKTCATLLRIDPSNKEASILLADVLFQKSEVTPAMHHFTQLLEKKPDNFVVLSRMITLLWRAGKLGDAEQYLERAKRCSNKSAHCAGFYYCRGLYCRYAVTPGEAIQNLNKARRDGEWGRRAIEAMVRVYITPGGTGTYLWEEQPMDGASGQDEATQAEQVIHSLMREPPMLPHTLHDDVLLCYGELLTRHKPKVDGVLRNCVKIIEQQRLFVPALLCMSVALMMNNQGPKARNQLKRICKIPYQQGFGEEFEEAYLMLATIYIDSKKYDLALELCKRCLKYNKSCSKAWEHMGLIMEKEHAYKDAAEYYERAWTFDSGASAPVGYKLAFNYLKAKRYIDAIDVCHKVLSRFPQYPRIRTDILEKAREALRQ